MIPGAVHRSRGIYLTSEKNGNPQLGNRQFRLSDQLSPQWGPFPPNEVGRTSQHARRGKRKKGQCWNVCGGTKIVSYTDRAVNNLFAQFL